MSAIKTAFIAMITFTALVITAVLVTLLVRMPQYPQATGIFPQVVTCVDEKPNADDSRNWKPTLIVTVEPGRDPGRVREYRVLGCRLYYYHDYSR